MAKLSEWRPYTRFVQSGMKDGKFLNASFTLLAAGPPRLAAIGVNSFANAISAGSMGGDDIVFPLGVVQNFNIGHNKQFNRIFEVGSDRSFWISGRTMGQVGLSRIMYHGPSLLRVLYAYYQDSVAPSVQTLLPNNPVTSLYATHDVKVAPGYDNLFLNLASDLFSQPIGLMAYFRDCDEQTVGAGYMEASVVPNHTIATDAQGTVIQESAAVQFERLVPVQVAALPLTGIVGDDAMLGIA